MRKTRNVEEGTFGKGTYKTARTAALSPCGKQPREASAHDTREESDHLKGRRRVAVGRTRKGQKKAACREGVVMVRKTRKGSEGPMADPPQLPAEVRNRHPDDAAPVTGTEEDPRRTRK